MFGLFKKKEAPKEPPSQQRDEWKEFAAPFLPDELSIVAVTDASGFGSVKPCLFKLFLKLFFLYRGQL